jgi:hypothetical protein
MAGYTDDEFESALVDDLGWRRVELSSLKRSLDSAAKQSPNGPATRGLSRAMVAMCYAHWEGYSKNGLDLYARLVTRRRPKLSEVPDDLALEHLRRLMKRVVSGDSDAKSAIGRAMRGESDDRLNLDRSLLSDTRANLRYETLTQLFTLGGIPIERFALKANLIDVLLCDRRNNVAHGRAYFVNPQESLTLCDDVILLMEEMQDVLNAQVRAKRYLRGFSGV